MSLRSLVWFVKHIIPWTITTLIIIPLTSKYPNLIDFGNAIPLTIAYIALGIVLSLAQDAIVRKARGR